MSHRAHIINAAFFHRYLLFCFSGAKIPRLRFPRGHIHRGNEIDEHALTVSYIILRRHAGTTTSAAIVVHCSEIGVHARASSKHQLRSARDAIIPFGVRISLTPDSRTHDYFRDYGWSTYIYVAIRIGMRYNYTHMVT